MRDREHYIPISRSELVELCLADGRLDEGEREPFCQFCDLVAASVHFRYHRVLEKLKRDYHPSDPEFAADGPSQEDPLTSLEGLLRQANFARMPDVDLQRALQQEGTVPLRTGVDFGDFERVLFYYQGRGLVAPVSGQKVEGFARVVLALRFKRKESHGERRGFTPGKTYIYLYRDVPAADLELLFPNVRIGMRARDLVGLMAPVFLATAFTGPTLVPQLSLLQRALASGEVGPVSGLLLTLLSVLLTVTGLAAKQTLSYKNRRLEFQRSVSELLFFHNLDCHRGVFYRLVDAAEEEESKEMILLYYHLLSHPEGSSRRQIDHEVERWLSARGLEVDFDIAKAVANWGQLRPEVLDRQGGRLRAAHVTEALGHLDRAWDRAFQYAC